MYNEGFNAEVSFDYKMLGKILTEYGIREGSLFPNQYVEINSIELNDDDEILVINCDINNKILN